mgnify:CR=1 FL=1
MLSFLRMAAKTWVFRILFGLLIVSFAVWGIGDLNLGGAGSRVAQVGERSISVDDYGLALSREINALQRRAERPISIDEAQAMGVPQALLARIVRDAALDEEARRLGLSADDVALRQAIVESPSFQGLDGRFDETQYRFVLNQLGFRVDRFESDLRRSLAREAVGYAVSRGGRAAPDLARRLAARELERRTVEALVVPFAAAPQPEAPSEEVLRAHHSENAEKFRKPEARTAAWLEIAPDALAATVEVPEDELRAAYDAAGARFDLPERRVVDRIVFRDAAEAEAAKARLDSGETDFAALAAARGLAAADIAMGELSRADLSDGADEIFSAGLGVVGPIRTPLGPALYEVRAVLPARVTSFEDARATLAAELAAERTAAAAIDMAERVADLLAAGAALEGIAEETGLPLRRAEAATRADLAARGLPDPLADEIFAAEPGEERDVIETGGGAFALVRVDDVTPAAPTSFEEARDRVLADWLAVEGRRLLEEAAAKGLERLENGATLAEVQAELGGDLQALPPFRRAEGLSAFDEAVVESLFAGDAPGGTALAVLGDELALLRVTEIAPADFADARTAEALDRLSTALDDGVASDLYAYYAAKVQERAQPTMNPAAIEQVVNSLR